jgi:hypothetical protein
MSASAFRKNPKQRNLTNKMLVEKLDQVSQLATSMELTLLEWQSWWMLLKNMKKNMSQEEFEACFNDGPIFSTIPEKIMKSIRDNCPFSGQAEPEEQKPAILDAAGNVANGKKVLLDQSGKPIV